MADVVTAVFILGLLMALLFPRTYQFEKHLVYFQRISVFRDRTDENTKILGNQNKLITKGRI